MHCFVVKENEEKKYIVSTTLSETIEVHFNYKYAIVYVIHAYLPT